MAADIAVKYLIRVFGFSYEVNIGGAFSLFSGQGWYFLSVGLAFLFILILRITQSKRGGIAGVDLILAGALSNIIDRSLHGGVTDYLGVWFLPLFNLADVAIVFGVIWLIFSQVIRPPVVQSS